MKALIVFNHPAPYKVRGFNELSKYVELDVIFERQSAKNRPRSFYNTNDYRFNVMFLKRGAFCNENSNTKELINYLKRNHTKYDHIIMNGYSTFTEMRAIRYMNKNNIKFILMINGGLIKKETKLKRKIKQNFISSAQYYLSPSKEADDYLIYYGANKENIFHYPYSSIYEKDILIKPLKVKEKMELRQRLGLPNNKIIISCSQFIRRKNNLKLLEIFKDRKETLLLIGDGEEKEAYLEYIKTNNIINIIIKPFLIRDDLLNYMKASDALITLSKEDIYGHTILEAMAMGLPVISSNKVISALSLINNGVNGFKVNITDNKEINTAITRVDYSKMSQSSLNIIRNYTIEKTGLKLFEALENIK